MSSLSHHIFCRILQPGMIDRLPLSGIGQCNGLPSYSRADAGKANTFFPDFDKIPRKRVKPVPFYLICTQPKLSVLNLFYQESKNALLWSQFLLQGSE